MFRVGVGWDEVLRVKGKRCGGIETHNLSPGHVIDVLECITYYSCFQLF